MILFKESWTYYTQNGKVIGNIKNKFFYCPEQTAAKLSIFEIEKEKNKAKCQKKFETA